MTDQLTLTVHGMTCGGCENAVKRAVGALDGVANVSASHSESRVTLTFDPSKVNRTAIVARIEAAGYEVGPV